MSGGAYNYAYCRVVEFAESMPLNTPARVRFKAHLLLVAEAMRAVEWVDSGDYGDGDDEDDIAKALHQLVTDEEKNP